MATFLLVSICSSCSRKGYYPHKKVIKGDCNCGGFGSINSKTINYE